MPFNEGSQPQTIESKETLGNKIQDKVEIFLHNSFDCIDKIEKTTNGGNNDTHGVDLVIKFED